LLLRGASPIRTGNHFEQGLAANLFKKSWKLTFPDFKGIHYSKLLRHLTFFPMQRLALSPLPCAVPPENAHSPMGGLGYVDDAVVLSLLTGDMGTRFPQDTGTPSLAEDELDYAGWPPSSLAGARSACLA
jgi:hypothetical protein